MIDGFAWIESELAAEKAAALARIAGTLEDLLRELASVREHLDRQDDEQRQAALAAHERLRERARLYRWYLEVQREAIGLRRHEGLDELYPIPPPLPSSAD